MSDERLDEAPQRPGWMNVIVTVTAVVSLVAIVVVAA